MLWNGGTDWSAVILLDQEFWKCQSCNDGYDYRYVAFILFGNV